MPLVPLAAFVAFVASVGFVYSLFQASLSSSAKTYGDGPINKTAAAIIAAAASDAQVSRVRRPAGVP